MIIVHIPFNLYTLTINSRLSLHLAKNTPSSAPHTYSEPWRSHPGMAHQADHLINPTPIISTHQVIGIFIFSVYLPSRSGCTEDQQSEPSPPPQMSSFLKISMQTRGFTRLNEQGRILLHYMTRWNIISTHLHTSNTSSSHTFESEAHCHQSQIPMIQSSHPMPDHHLNTLDHLPVIASFHFPNLSRPSAPNSSNLLLETGHVLLIVASNPSTTYPSINHCMSCSRLHQFYQETKVSWTNTSHPDQKTSHKIQTPWRGGGGCIEDYQK